MNALTLSLRWISLAFVALTAGVGLSPAGAAYAAGPKVGFDLGYMVECRDVTQQAFAILHPDEKVIEANLRVSVRLLKGEEQDIEQLLFELTSPTERLRVVDFLPKTQIEPESTDGISVTKTTETVHSFGGSLGTNLAVSAGNGKHNSVTLTQALPAVNGNSTHRNQLQETSKKIAPGKVIIAAGTLDNEHGVFFKLKRSAVTPFEGTRTLSFRFVVPSQWRGDWIVLSAQATGRVKHYFFKSIEPCGDAKAFIGLYLAGDADAELAARELAEGQELYFASKPDNAGHSMAITELATAARPWQTVSNKPAVKSASITSRICYKPFDPFCRNVDARGETHKEPDASATLKQTLDRMATYSDAVEFRIAPSNGASAMR
ncbi:MAG TPA: hypothetical protein VHC19_26415 [Pirellulales bacterium]|nr:hypothetical protein [Pirellulales bacterium]